MILLLLPDKQIQQIIQIVSHYLKEENKKEINLYLRRINL